MFQVEDSWTSLIGGLLAATRGLLKTRRDRSEPKMFDEDDVELSDEYADDDDRGSDDGTGIHNTLNKHLKSFISNWMGRSSLRRGTSRSGPRCGADGVGQ